MSKKESTSSAIEGRQHEPCESWCFFTGPTSNFDSKFLDSDFLSRDGNRQALGPFSRPFYCTKMAISVTRKHCGRPLHASPLDWGGSGVALGSADCRTLHQAENPVTPYSVLPLCAKSITWFYLPSILTVGLAARWCEHNGGERTKNARFVSSAAFPFSIGLIVSLASLCLFRFIPFCFPHVHWRAAYLPWPDCCTPLAMEEEGG